MDESRVLSEVRDEWSSTFADEDCVRSRPWAYDADRDTPLSAALARLFLAGRNKRCECGGEDAECIHQDECLAWHAVRRLLGEG